MGGELRSCPGCGNEVVVDGVYPPWCEDCGWGLRPPAPRKPKNAVDRLGFRAARRLDATLFEQLARDQDLRPRTSAARVAGMAIAIATHLFTLGLVIAAVWMVVSIGTPPLIFFAVALAGVAWLMRPRLGKPPKKGIVAREDTPRLHELIDEVSRAVGVEPPTIVVLDDDLNASWSVVGLRRQRVLTLGLPLLAMLEGPELVALLAHELAHDRNGDPLRGFIVGTSVNALIGLYISLSPEPGASAAFGGILEDIANAVLALLRLPVRGVLELQYTLLMRDSHRAEYLADEIAARVAGTDAEIAMKEKLLLGSVVDAVVQRDVLSGNQGDDAALAMVRRSVRDVPERERERRRRVARLEPVELRSTHPPTGRRIELLERRPHLDAEVVLSSERSAGIENELAHREQQVSRDMVAAFREGLRFATG